MRQPTDQEYQVWQKMFPGTFQLIGGRRYELPQKLSDKYMSQDQNIEDVFMRVLTRLPDLVDQAQAERRARFLGAPMQAVSLINWINHGCKLLWLEPYLGDLLLRTKTLPDITVEDLVLPWESFRVMVPLGLIQVKEGDVMRSVTAITIAREGGEIPIPQVIREELGRVTGQRFGTLKIENNTSGHDAISVMYTLTAGRQDHNTGLICTWEPIDKLGLRESLSIVDEVEIVSDRLNFNQCREGLKLAKKLVFNLLVTMCDVPAVGQEVPIRKARVEGKNRIRPAIYRAHWCGERVFKQFDPLPEYYEARTPTGRHLPGHLVCGHLKRLPTGFKAAPGRRTFGPQGNIIWIMPYRTHGIEQGITSRELLGELDVSVANTIQPPLHEGLSVAGREDLTSAG